MWDFGECCSECKSKGGIVIDRVAKKISCYECGLDFVLSDRALSIFSTEPDNASFDGFLTTSDNENVQNPRFDPLSTAIIKPDQASSDAVIIADMSDRLGLLETVKNQAIEIFEKIKSQSIPRRNVHFAACIFIACRQNHIAMTIHELCPVAGGASASSIVMTIRSIAAKLDLQLDQLMQIRAADYADRFCSTLQMDSQVARAAQEAADVYSRFINSSRSPLPVAAVVVYVIARVSYEKKLLKDIMDATGVQENTITETYKDLYPYLSTITPTWFANAKDLKKLGSP